MKKAFAILLALIIVISMLAGCGSRRGGGNSKSEKSDRGYNHRADYENLHRRDNLLD